MLTDVWLFHRPCRRPSQKAWTQGTNPITQRNINNSLPNGTPHQARNAAKGSLVPHHDLLSADRHADDRLLYLLANCVVSRFIKILLLCHFSMLHSCWRCSSFRCCP